MHPYVQDYKTIRFDILWKQESCWAEQQEQTFSPICELLLVHKMIALVLLKVAGLTLAGCFNMLEGKTFNL